MTATETLSPATRWSSIVVVWVAALACSIVIGIFSHPNEYSAWLGLTLAGCTIAALCIQLATQEKQGFVGRLTASVVGALGVLVIAAGILALTTLWA